LEDRVLDRGAQLGDPGQDQGEIVFLFKRDFGLHSIRLRFQFPRHSWCVGKNRFRAEFDAHGFPRFSE
jgi:hypothetical protein